jgi:ankyrin repeat protein
MASELIIACKQNDIGRVRELLDSGADPNLLDTNGLTALVWATGQGNIDVVRLLLDYGADPNLHAPDRWTAPDLASLHSNTDVVYFLEAACRSWNAVKPLEDLDIFPDGMIRENLPLSLK